MDAFLPILFDKFLNGTRMSRQEVVRLQELVLDEANTDALDSLLREAYMNPAYAESRDYDRTEAFEALKARMHLQGTMPATARRVHFLPRRWFRYAAAIILVAGITTAVVVSSDRQRSNSQKDVAVIPSDILPGTNKAVLTVDNKDIDLSSDKTGITVGNDITYTDGEKLSEAGKMLALTTPNGGQYQLVLPDGTKAWLNAASSISFPSAFRGEKREVKITGEVYLEVAKDKSKPFFVDVDGQSSIQVLGTSFNVNSYGDEGEIRATLVEGSIKVGTSRGAFNGNSVTLKPGQQALLPLYTTADAMSSDRQPDPSGTDGSDKIIVNSNIDLSQTLAWKNGLFSFNNTDLRSAMKQLERWYDIKVRYEGKVSNITLEGEMFRNVKLSEVLDLLKELGLKFRIEGNILVVL